MRHTLGMLVATLIGIGCGAPSENLPTPVALERAEEGLRLVREGNSDVLSMLGTSGIWSMRSEPGSGTSPFWTNGRVVTVDGNDDGQRESVFLVNNDSLSYVGSVRSSTGALEHLAKDFLQYEGTGLSTFLLESEATQTVSIEAKRDLGMRADYCVGTVPKFARLGEIGITPLGLQGGVDCVVADFDGNGEEDYLLFGADVRLQGTRLRMAYLVIFVEEGRILDQEIIDRGLARPILYPAGDDVGVFGEPASPLPGFWDPGEGATSRVFLFDTEARRFRMTEYRSEYD